MWHFVIAEIWRRRQAFLSAAVSFFTRPRYL
jgi:hypothetical protein